MSPMAISGITRDIVANSEPVPPEAAIWFFVSLFLIVVVVCAAAVVVAKLMSEL